MDRLICGFLGYFYITYFLAYYIYKYIYIYISAASNTYIYYTGTFEYRYQYRSAARHSTDARASAHSVECAPAPARTYAGASVQIRGGRAGRRATSIIIIIILVIIIIIINNPPWRAKRRARGQAGTQTCEQPSPARSYDCDSDRRLG